MTAEIINFQDIRRRGRSRQRRHWEPEAHAPDLSPRERRRIAFWGGTTLFTYYNPLPEPRRTKELLRQVEFYIENVRNGAERQRQILAGGVFVRGPKQGQPFTPERRKFYEQDVKRYERLVAKCEAEAEALRGDLAEMRREGRC